MAGMATIEPLFDDLRARREIPRWPRWPWGTRAPLGGELPEAWLTAPAIPSRALANPVIEARGPER